MIWWTWDRENPPYRIERFYSDNGVIFIFRCKSYNICMGEKEHLILQNRFQEWFENPVPADLPPSAEVDHSVEDPVPTDLSLPGAMDHTKRRRRENKSAKLLELFIHGFGGAVFFGSVVGFIIYIFNWSFGGRYSQYWLIQFLVVFLAMILGFYNSLVKGFSSKKRKR